MKRHRCWSMTSRTPTVPRHRLALCPRRSLRRRSGSGRRRKLRATQRSCRKIGIESIGMGPTTSHRDGRRLEVLGLYKRLSLSLTHGGKGSLFQFTSKAIFR